MTTHHSNYDDAMEYLNALSRENHPQGLDFDRQEHFAYRDNDEIQRNQENLQPFLNLQKSIADSLKPQQRGLLDEPSYSCRRGEFHEPFTTFNDVLRPESYSIL